MEASEVLRRYRAGDRDFRHANLRGQSFQGKNLAKADFSEADFRYADIRGANFNNSKFVGAKFSGAKAGLQKRWFVGLVLFFWLMSGLIVVAAFALVFALDLSLPMISLPMIQSGNFQTPEVRYETVIKLIELYLKTLTVVLLPDAYIIWRTFQGDKHYSWIYIAFVAARGTRFHGADLTNADFTGAELKSTDFRESKLTCTRWYNAKNIDRACVGTSYLSNKQIRRLLVKGEGNDENFDRQDLRSLNLSGSKLKNASFIDAYLYQTNLSGSDLSGALLIRTTLEKADLTNTCLTGACIQGWNITSRTKLKGAESKYVYMKLVDGNKRDEIPHGGKFKKGEFVSFVRSMLNTLELYHKLDINPHVAVAVLKSLSAKYQMPLEIVGFRKQGNAFILQVKIAGEIGQEEIQKGYRLKYEEYLNLFIEDPSQFHELLSPRTNRDEARLLEKLEEGKEQNTVINNINYTIIQKGPIGVGVNPGIISAKKIAGTTNDAQDIMQMIESLRQQIEALDNQAVCSECSEALEHLDDVKTEIQSSSPRKSRLKASLITLWNIVKDTALVANAVTALAARVGIQLPPLP